MLRKVVVFACLVASTVGCLCARGADDLRVLPEKLGDIAPDQMMKEYLLSQIDQEWRRACAEYEQRTTPEAIADYQKRMYDQFIKLLGDLPERTPLNPQTVGIIERNGYKVEKVLFESRPSFHVSAALFLPDPTKHKGPRPGVLIPCGHAANAKAHVPYQTMGALLALNGMVALVFDPIDQGERFQLLGDDDKPVVGGTDAHTLLGAAYILLGNAPAIVEIWDGIRALDYLQSRPEVDPERIGCTGNSGGGTQTSYLMALEPRIKAAAPSCYIHHQSVQLRKATGDAEQNLFGQLVTGPDHPDFIMMRAPRPTLICAATKDFFDIHATWETFRMAKRLYTRMGFPERMDLLENDMEHNFDKIPRQGVARWMSRWLLQQDQAIVEPEIEPIKDADIWCAPNGHVVRLQGERSIHEINVEIESGLAKARKARWSSEKGESLLKEVRALAGVRPMDELKAPEVQSVGQIKRPECTIEKLILIPEPGVSLPALMLAPANAKPGQSVLIVAEKGIAEAAGEDGPAQGYLKDGYTVLAVDVRGLGETYPGVGKKVDKRIGADWEDYFRAYVLGRSYVGMRAEDILRSAAYLRDKGFAVRLAAYGNVGVPALHAAALEPSVFETVTISGALRSWSDVIRARPAVNQLINTVQGALKVYDLPDLAATLGDKLVQKDPVDAEDKPV